MQKRNAKINILGTALYVLNSLSIKKTITEQKAKKMQYIVLLLNDKLHIRFDIFTFVGQSNRPVSWSGLVCLAAKEEMQSSSLKTM